MKITQLKNRLVLTELHRKMATFSDVLTTEFSLSTSGEFKEAKHLIELTEEEFADFASDLLADRDYLKNLSGIAIVTTSSLTDIGNADDPTELNVAIVDTQGYDYARYTGLLFGMRYKSEVPSFVAEEVDLDVSEDEETPVEDDGEYDFLDEKDNGDYDYLSETGFAKD